VLTKFEDIIEKVLEHEGGYVNDPDDPGGETMMGISKRAYPNLDISGLSRQDVIDIYKKDYWDRNRVDSFPDKLRYIYFDMCVNMGKSRAVKIIQQACNSKKQNLSVDGGLGPLTLKSVRKCKLSPSRVRAYRIKYYANLVDKKPILNKYYYGWFKRSLSV
jgi:lysozyme family protein